jgi:hypothetical protein
MNSKRTWAFCCLGTQYAQIDRASYWAILCKSRMLKRLNLFGDKLGHFGLCYL